MSTSSARCSPSWPRSLAPLRLRASWRVVWPSALALSPASSIWVASAWNLPVRSRSSSRIRPWVRSSWASMVAMRAASSPRSLSSVSPRTRRSDASWAWARRSMSSRASPAVARLMSWKASLTPSSSASVSASRRRCVSPMTASSRRAWPRVKRAAAAMPSTRPSRKAAVSQGRAARSGIMAGHARCSARPLARLVG